MSELARRYNRMIIVAEERRVKRLKIRGQLKMKFSI